MVNILLFKVFKGNSDRNQTLAMLAKEGFIAEKIDLYYDDIDPADAEGKKILFSRGPAFVTFTTPQGNKLCVGVTHIKSKYGDNPEMVKRRGRQTARLGEICEEYIADGIGYVAILGDFNDSYGMDKNEQQAGIDAVAQTVVGHDNIVALTKPAQRELAKTLIIAS